MHFSETNHEKLELPEATRLQKLSSDGEDVVVVNVTRVGDIKVAGRTVTDRRLEAEFAAKRRRFPDPADPTLARFFVLIRADRDADFEKVQKILMCASKYGGVTRILFGAVEQDSK